MQACLRVGLLLAAVGAFAALVTLRTVDKNANHLSNVTTQSNYSSALTSEAAALLADGALWQAANTAARQDRKAHITTKWQEMLQQDWSCPCKNKLGYSSISFDLSTDFPCRRIVQQCHSNATFASMLNAYIGSTNLTFMLGRHTCPGAGSADLPVSADDLPAMFQFCDLLGQGPTMTVNVPTTTIDVLSLIQLARDSMNRRLTQFQDVLVAKALQSGGPEGPDLALAAHRKALFDSVRALYNGISMAETLQDAPGVAALEDLGWYSSLMTFTFRAPAANYTVDNEPYLCRQAQARGKGLCAAQFWYLVYFDYVTGVCEPILPCTRVHLKGFWFRVTEWAGLLGGMLSLIFIVILPNLWNWAIAPLPFWKHPRTASAVSVKLVVLDGVKVA
jgi:hypothetical protein